MALIQFDAIYIARDLARISQTHWRFVKWSQ